MQSETRCYTVQSKTCASSCCLDSQHFIYIQFTSTESSPQNSESDWASPLADTLVENVSGPWAELFNMKPHNSFPQDILSTAHTMCFFSPNNGSMISVPRPSAAGTHHKITGGRRKNANREELRKAVHFTPLIHPYSVPLSL